MDDGIEWNALAEKAFAVVCAVLLPVVIWLINSRFCQ